VAPEPETDRTRTLPDRIGPYLVTGTLGAGGMGVVYQAVHEDGGAAVALKTVQAHGESVLFGLRREIRALRALEHPGVVRVLSDGTHQGTPYYVMEVLDGPTMRSLRGPPGEARTVPTADERTEALGVVAAVCRTLAFVHGRGVVHRDLKPDNVLLTADRGPVLVDFGIAALSMGASAREVLETAGRTYGSPGYMAPEQVRGDLVDARADLYAIGCILYEHLTGRLPFEGEATHVLFSKKVHTDPPPPSALVPEIPRALDQLVMRLLARKKEARPGHAADVEAALLGLGARRLGQDGPPAELYLYRPRLAGREAVLSLVTDAIGEAGGRTAPRAAPTSTSPLSTSSSGPTTFRDRPTVALPSPSPSPTVHLETPTLATRAIEASATRVDVTLDVTSSVPASRSSGAMIVIGGESGVGKTRLAMEAASLAARRSFSVVTGECVRVGAEGDAGAGLVGAPLHPLNGLLLAALDACRDPAAFEAILGPHARVLADFQPGLAELPGFHDHPAPPSVPPDATRARLDASLGAVLAGFATRAPVLLVLDDLQWADEHTFRFLESLDEAFFRAHQVIILATYRADEVTAPLRALASRPFVRHATLDRLDGDSLESVARDMLAVDEVPTELVAFLRDRTAGNPFFVAEYLRTAVERGLVSRDGVGRFRFDATLKGALELMPAPRALLDVVGARIDRLDAGAREVARMIAVLGREVDASVVADALGQPELLGADSISELLRRAVIEEQAGTLRFVHDKLREAASASIPARERAAMHREAARALTAKAERVGDPDRFVGELAHHHAEAGSVERALVLLDRAGELAVRVGSYRDALRFFERALSLAPEPTRLTATERVRQARWVRRAAEAHHATGDLGAAERRGREALRLAHGAATLLDHSYDVGLRGKLRYALGTGRAVVTQLGLAARAPSRGSHGSQRELSREAALAAEKLGQTYMFLNDSVRAGIATVVAGNHAAELGPSPELARASAQLALAAVYVPAHRLARRYVARAGRISRELAEPDTELVVAFMRGFWALGATDGREASEHLARARDLARARSDRRREEEALALIGLNELVHGRHGESLDVYEELVVLAERSQNLQSRMWAHSGRGQLYSRIGRPAAAAAEFARIAEVVEQTPDRLEEVQLAHTAPMYARSGDLERARRVAVRTLELVDDGPPVGSHLISSYTATCEAFFTIWERTEGAEARRSISRHTARAVRAMGRFARVFPVGRAEAERFAGLLSLMQGADQRGLASLARAVDAARAFDLPFEEARAHFELARFGPGRDRIHHRGRARELFTSTGAWGSLETLESEL
jgi:serine/threonine protein kinase/tetratricopeptide (TPR) repeat protein